MNNALKIYNFLNDTGMLAVAVTILVGWFTRVSPWLKHKAEAQKTAKQRDALLLLDQVATNAVNKLATFYEMPGDEKRVKAIAQTTSQLHGMGHDLDSELVSAAVEKVYQYMTVSDTAAQSKQAKYDEALVVTEDAFAKKQAAMAAKQGTFQDATVKPLNVPTTTNPTEGDED